MQLPGGSAWTEQWRKKPLLNLNAAITTKPSLFKTSLHRCQLKPGRKSHIGKPHMSISNKPSTATTKIQQRCQHWQRFRHLQACYVRLPCQNMRRMQLNDIQWSTSFSVLHHLFLQVVTKNIDPEVPKSSPQTLLKKVGHIKLYAKHLPRFQMHIL